MSRHHLKWISESQGVKDEERFCFLCGFESPDFQCKWCRKIYYCSKEHYSCHRFGSKCYPRINIGDYVRVSRNIKKGEILFAEKPAITSPNPHSLPTCPKCLKRIKNLSASINCPDGCPLRMCGNPCGSTELSHGPECRILRENKVKLDYGDYESPMSIFSVILTLRTLEFQRTKSRDWNTFFENLQDQTEKRKTAKGEWNLFQKDVVDFIRKRLFMASEIDDEGLHKLIGIFMINSTSFQNGCGRGLYPSFSRMKYDCIGNSKFSINPNTGIMTIKAKKPLIEGQIITINYCPSILGTHKRRKKLKSEYYIDCLCPRCSDPTELDTFVSALVCENCEKGMMLPEKPLDPYSSWPCSICDFELRVEEVERIVDRAEEELTEISMKKDLLKIGEFVDHYEGKILGSNHYLILIAKRNYVLISRKNRIKLVVNGAGETLYRSASQSKIEPYKDFWWIVERLSCEECF